MLQIAAGQESRRLAVMITGAVGVLVTPHFKLSDASMQVSIVHVYNVYYKYKQLNTNAIQGLWIVYFRNSRSLRAPPCSKILNPFH